MLKVVSRALLGAFFVTCAVIGTQARADGTCREDGLIEKSPQPGQAPRYCMDDLFNLHKADVQAFDALTELVRSDETWYLGYRTKGEANYSDSVLKEMGRFQSNSGSRTCQGSALILAMAIQVKYHDTSKISKALDDLGCAKSTLPLILSFPLARNYDFALKVADGLVVDPSELSYVRADRSEFSQRAAKHDVPLTLKLAQTVSAISDKRLKSQKDRFFWASFALREILWVNAQNPLLIDDQTLALIDRLTKVLKSSARVFNPKPRENPLSLLNSFCEYKKCSATTDQFERIAKVFVTNGYSINDTQTNSLTSYKGLAKCSQKNYERPTPYLVSINAENWNLKRAFERLEKPITAPFGQNGPTALLMALMNGNTSYISEIERVDPTLPLDGCVKPVSRALSQSSASPTLFDNSLKYIPAIERNRSNTLLTPYFDKMLWQFPGDDHEQYRAFGQKIIDSGVSVEAFFRKSIEMTCFTRNLELINFALEKKIDLGLAEAKNSEALIKCVDSSLSNIYQSSHSKGLIRAITGLVIQIKDMGKNEALVRVIQKQVQATLPGTSQSLYEMQVLAQVARASSPRQWQAARQAYSENKPIAVKYPKIIRSKPHDETLTYRFNDVGFKIKSSYISDAEFKMLNLLEENPLDGEGLSLAVDRILSQHAKVAGRTKGEILAFRDRIRQAAQVSQLSKLKTSWEKAFAPAGGGPLLYNLSAANIFSFLTGRMQCFSGTLMNSLSLSLNPQLLKTEIPVAIFTSGHVLSGYLSPSGGAWKLTGTETTVEGHAQIQFGDTRRIEIAMRVIELREFLLTTIFGDRMSNGEEFSQGISKVMERKYGIRQIPKQAGKGGQPGLNSSLFGFGQANVPSGDLSRKSQGPLKVEGYSSAGPKYLELPQVHREGSVFMSARPSYAPDLMQTIEQMRDRLRRAPPSPEMSEIQSPFSGPESLFLESVMSFKTYHAQGVVSEGVKKERESDFNKKFDKEYDKDLPSFESMGFACFSDDPKMNFEGTLTESRITVHNTRWAKLGVAGVSILHSDVGQSAICVLSPAVINMSLEQILARINE